MEENKDDIIYDLLNSTEGEYSGGQSHGEEEEADASAGVLPEVKEADTDGNTGGNEEGEGDQEEADGKKIQSEEEAALQRMVKEMGAAALLDIIRDNRNAAIRQILNEVEASRNKVIPSGTSVASRCSSIFDLAALAY